MYTLVTIVTHQQVLMPANLLTIGCIQYNQREWCVCVCVFVCVVSGLIVIKKFVVLPFEK